jgi:hypothetical protein
MLHGAIFLATCNAILLLRDVKSPNTSLHYTPYRKFCNAILLLRDVKLPNTSLHYTPLMFSQHIENPSLISLINISQEYRIALQVARKIAPCNMALSYECSAQVYVTHVR